MERKKIIAVDFDGTLHLGKDYPFIGEPNTKLIEWIKENRTRYIFTLHTCRAGRQLKFALDWLNEQGLKFDFVNENTPMLIKEFRGDTRKIFADCYIDANAYRPEEIIEMPLFEV